MSNTLYQRNWYLPTFLRSDDDSCTLVGHVYTITTSAVGAITLENEMTCWDFPTDDDLAEFIRETQAAELPLQADGDPQFVPEQVQQRVAAMQSRN